MSYKHYEISGFSKLGELPADEQAYILGEWESLCNRKAINTSERIFFQKPNGRFFKATRGRINASRYSGCSGGYWAISYGNSKCWGFKKNPFGEYDPEPCDKFFSSLTLNTGETVNIPKKVHTKKDAMELAKSLGFNIEA